MNPLKIADEIKPHTEEGYGKYENEMLHQLMLLDKTYQQFENYIKKKSSTFLDLKHYNFIIY